MSVSIKGFIETSFLDWPGQMASVVFLGGCNFRCPFCHNHPLVLSPDRFRDLNPAAIFGRLSKFRDWIDGVVVSGGEPTLQPGLPDFIAEIRAAGFKVKLDTNGSRPEVLAGLLDEGLLDHVAMDIKASLDDTSYARACGRLGYLLPVKKSLALLADFQIPYTLRTTVVPGLHGEKDILRLAEQLQGEPEWVLQRFRPDNALDPGYRETPAQSQEAFDALSIRARELQSSAPVATAA